MSHYNNSILKSHGAYFPESGKCIHLDRAFYITRNSTGFVSHSGHVITGLTLREARWDIQRDIIEHSPFIQAYDHAPYKRMLEEHCIKVYSEPMNYDQVLEFIKIAKAEGWILQYRDHTKMKCGKYWMWLFSTKNHVNDIIKSIDIHLYDKWIKLPPIKKMARTSLIFGSHKILQTPESRPFRVGILPIDTKGWGLIDKDILRLNGIDHDVVKGGLLMKSILRGASHAEMQKILQKFGVELTLDYISHFDLLLGTDEDKFGVIGAGQCLDKIAYNPDHTPANIANTRVTMRWDAELIEGMKPVADLDEIKQILANNKMSKEETVKWLAYTSKDKIDIRMGTWLAYLGLPLSMCNSRIFWECVGARIKSLFWTHKAGFTGTLLDEMLAPKWIESKKTGAVKLPPALPSLSNKPKIWYDEGIMFIDGKVIDNMHRDNDGDLGQWISEGFDFTVDGAEWKQEMPEEIEHKDTRKRDEALAAQLQSENYTGQIHSQHMIIMSVARYLEKGEDVYKDIMNMNRFYTEKFIMMNKYHMEFESPMSLYEMAKKYDLPYWRVKRERTFASLLRNGRIDELVEFCNEKHVKPVAPFFEAIAYQLKDLKMSEDKVATPKELKFKKDRTELEQLYVNIDNVRKQGFVWLKNNTVETYKNHENFNRHEFLAGLDDRKPMYKIVGPHMMTEDIDEQKANLDHNMDKRFMYELGLLKKMETVDLYREAEILLSCAIMANEYEYSTWLWNRYWKKEEERIQKEAVCDQ